MSVGQSGEGQWRVGACLRGRSGPASWRCTGCSGCAATTWPCSARWPPSCCRQGNTSTLWQAPRHVAHSQFHQLSCPCPCRIALHCLPAIALHCLPPSPLNASPQHGDVRSDPAFWALLQAGLLVCLTHIICGSRLHPVWLHAALSPLADHQSDDSLARKRALHLLRHVVAASRAAAQHSPALAGHGGPLGRGPGDIGPGRDWDAARATQLQRLWEDYYLVCETLDEKQTHIVLYVLSGPAQLSGRSCRGCRRWSPLPPPRCWTSPGPPSYCGG